MTTFEELFGAPIPEGQTIDPDFLALVAAAAERLHCKPHGAIGRDNRFEQVLWYSQHYVFSVSDGDDESDSEYRVRLADIMLMHLPSGAIKCDVVRAYEGELSHTIAAIELLECMQLSLAHDSHMHALANARAQHALAIQAEAQNVNLRAMAEASKIHKASKIRLIGRGRKS